MRWAGRWLWIGLVSGAEAFRPAVEAGVQLVFLSNVPEGYVHGTDYVGVVTDDLAARRSVRLSRRVWLVFLSCG